ncbi:MAG: PIN domain-containing protein [Armatimonadota bacterium]
MPEVLVDANVLLRHLTGQPAALASRAAEIMRAAEQGRISLVVTPLTLAECIWVLETSYRKAREAIADALSILLQAPGIVAREQDAVLAALDLYRTIPRLDFADTYLAGVATHAGPPRIASFDQGLRRISGLTVLSAKDL